MTYKDSFLFFLFIKYSSISGGWPKLILTGPAIIKLYFRITGSWPEQLVGSSVQNSECTLAIHLCRHLGIFRLVNI